MTNINYYKSLEFIIIINPYVSHILLSLTLLYTVNRQLIHFHDFFLVQYRFCDIVDLIRLFRACN